MAGQGVIGNLVTAITGLTQEMGRGLHQVGAQVLVRQGQLAPFLLARKHRARLHNQVIHREMGGAQGEGLPRSAQLTDHAIHLLLAGLDTVSQMSALLLHHLGQSEHAVETLAAEASSGIAEPPYTEAVIKEIVRLYAGVPVAVRVSGAPIELRGCTIPTHRPNMAFLVCMQRDERSFERALEYLPERWIEGSPLRMDQSAYMPFGTGPHICIGETAAKLIMRRTIPAICRRFRVESCAQGVVPVLIRIVALPLHPPRVILRAR